MFYSCMIRTIVANDFPVYKRLVSYLGAVISYVLSAGGSGLTVAGQSVAPAVQCVWPGSLIDTDYDGS